MGREQTLDNDEETSKHRGEKKDYDSLAMVFGSDIRSMALMRICLSIIILLDLYVRSWYMHDHYTNWAVWPPSQAMDNTYSFSFHFINPVAPFQYLLFFLNALGALSLLVGFKTRASTFFCWLMMVSLHNRNIYVLNAGDDMLRLFLFWSMFLPLGRCASIDSIHNSKLCHFQSNYYVSFSSVAAMLQFCIVYWFTAFLKTGKEWNVDYTATYFALNLDQFATKWGVMLREYPDLMKLFTIGVIYWEKVGPCLFFVPARRIHGPIRTFAVLGFLALHIGFGTCMELGFFMYIPGACVMLFLPSWFWDNLISLLRSPKRLSIVIYYGSSAPSVHKALLLFRTFFLLHETPILPATSEEGEDMKGLQNSWFSVVDKSTNETLSSHAAVVKLCSVSPILYVFVPILKLQVMARAYYFIASKFGEGVIHTINHNTPNKPYHEWPKYGRWSKDILACLLFLYILNWNCAAVFKYSVPNSIRWIGPSLKVDQWWGMFSPHPPKTDGWLVMPARLKDGTEIDLFRGGGPVSYDKPSLVSAMYPTQRWRKFMMNLQRDSNKDKRLHYGRYLCREWNFWERHPPEKQLVGYKIFFMSEKTPEPGNPPKEITKSELWDHEC